MKNFSFTKLKIRPCERAINTREFQRSGNSRIKLAGAKQPASLNVRIFLFRDYMRAAHIAFKINTEVSFVGKLKTFFFFLLALYSMRPYFFWSRPFVSAGFALGVFLLTLCEYFTNNRYRVPFLCRQDIVSLCAFICFFLWNYLLFMGYFNPEDRLVSLIGSFLTTFFPILFFILQPLNEKRYFLRVMTYGMALICSVSLFFFILFLLGVNLPNHKIYHPTNLFYKWFDDYGAFIIVHSSNLLAIPRFQSVFTEPGHLGMMCALLLYANEYNFKKAHNIVLLVSTIFSLSLAAYVLLVIGIFLFKFINSRRKVVFVVSMLFVTAVSGIGGIIFYFTHPESVFTQRILVRLVFDKDKGIAGNNRNTKQFDNEFDRFSRDSGLFWGTAKTGMSIKTKFPNGGNSSYKTYIYDYGLLGIILLALFYLSFISKNKHRKFMLGMFLLWSASFLQRPYATWLAQILIFASYSAKESSS